LERAEKGENMSDLQRELREKARIQMKPESEDDKLCQGNNFIMKLFHEFEKQETKQKRYQCFY
jgi:hypothetical protein